MSESVVLCEGYHDRAFWAALLEHLGCVDPGRLPGKPGRKRVFDPRGRPVVGGQFAFRTTGGRFVRVVPCNGKTNVLPEARSRLREVADELDPDDTELQAARLVINLDPDISSSDPSTKTGFRKEDLLAELKKFDPAPKETDEGDFRIFDAGLTVSLIRWETVEDTSAGLPDPQTLERLVCAALVAAYPARGPIVEEWIGARLDAPPAGPKEFAWSHMAGWYAENGCEAFYRRVWEDPRVVAELETRLKACGAWRIAQSLAE